MAGSGIRSGFRTIFQEPDPTWPLISESDRIRIHKTVFVRRPHVMLDHGKKCFEKSRSYRTAAVTHPYVALDVEGGGAREPGHQPIILIDKG
jgi:hypothetical protein